MSNVIHRTVRKDYKLIREFSVNTPDYEPPASSDWIVNPDLSSVAAVSEIYWKAVGNTIVAMDAGEQTAVNQAIASVNTQATHDAIVSRSSSVDPLAGVTYSVDVTGLVITVNITNLLVNDLTTIVPDASLTMFVKTAMIYDKLLDVISVVSFTRTNGLFALLGSNESLLKELGEWSVVASGTVLVEV